MRTAAGDSARGGSRDRAAEEDQRPEQTLLRGAVPVPVNSVRARSAGLGSSRDSYSRERGGRVGCRGGSAAPAGPLPPPPFDHHDDTLVASGCRLAEMIRLFGGRDGAARRPLAKFRGGGGSRRRFFARGLIQLESRAQL